MFDNELTLITGNNASGKTTFLNILSEKLKHLNIKYKYFNLNDFYKFKEQVDICKSTSESLELFIDSIINNLKVTDCDYILLDDIFNLIRDFNKIELLVSNNYKVISTFTLNSIGNGNFDISSKFTYLLCTGGKYGFVSDGINSFKYDQYINYAFRSYKIDLLLN